MYYKRYVITNDDNYKDINILRFSYNPYNTYIPIDIRVKKLLRNDNLYNLINTLSKVLF